MRKEDMKDMKDAGQGMSYTADAEAMICQVMHEFSRQHRARGGRILIKHGARTNGVHANVSVST